MRRWPRRSAAKPVPRPSATPSSDADTKLANQIAPGWQQLTQGDQPTSGLITVPGLGHFTVKGKSGTNLWVQDGNYNLNISPEALQILKPRSGDPTVPTDYMGKRLQEFHDLSVAPKAPHIFMPFRKVTSSEAQRVYTETGVDISGYTHFIDTEHIRHILNQHAGPDEVLRGQVPVTRADLKDIPQVLENPDTIKLSRPTINGQNTLIYGKRINGHITYIATVSKGKRMIMATTMWKRP